MSDHLQSDINNLHADVARLKLQVAQLEHTVAALRGQRVDPAPQPYTRPTREPATAAPAAPTAHPAAAAGPQPPAAPSAPPQRNPLRPVTEPVQIPQLDWQRIGEQVFTARTLAWAGGVATALGIALLFIMAASRGWVTPPMRVGIGVAVATGMLAAAVELDRRKWRADSILAAAGVGIAGLYTCLWASTSLYEWFEAPVALPLAALIAGLAVAVAIRIRQEPLAVFGVCAAMVAPVLVSLDVTAGGVLFATIMAAAALPLHWRFRWQWLLTGAWAVAFLETAALLVASSDHIGFGLAVIDAALVVELFAAILFQLELRPAQRTRISGLGWLVASSAFAVSMGGTFLFAGQRMAGGHSLAGLTLIGVTAIWAALAAVPALTRRSHPELTDLLAAFSLAAAATATGLLAGGPALVCAWAAESALLVGVAERMARRSGARRMRVTAAAGIYLGLAAVRALAIVIPTDGRLPDIGQGSDSGTIALTALAVAGIAFCYGTRWISRREQVVVWALPALAVGYLPLWALPAEWAVVAEAGLAAAVFVYRRTPFTVAWLRDEPAIVIGSGFWATGAVLALAVTAPLDSFDGGWDALGSRDGLSGLCALVAAAVVLAWSVRRPTREGSEFALLLPAVTLAYLIAEALAAPYAFWAWLAVAAVLAACIHIPELRRRLGEDAGITSAVMLFALGVAGGWSADQSLRAFGSHGRGDGWDTIAIASLAGLVVVSGIRDIRIRSYAGWVPFALAAQLAAMLLEGQYPVVVWAALSGIVSLMVYLAPGVLRTRLDRRPLRELSLLSALGVSTIVLLAYETPGMLFETTRSPASGLAAAVAATIAMFLAAAAAGRRPDERESWSVSGMAVRSVLAYAAGAAALWTFSAAILGAGQLLLDHPSPAAVHDRFQQGHVLVSMGWALVGLALVIVSLRGDRRRLRVGGIALLFVALGKLFLYDLAYLDAMARAISFIASGTVLLLAALLLQRFAPHVKAALGEDDASHTTV